MKPKDFLRKYSIETGWQTKYQHDFLNDMTNELLIACEASHAEDNLKGFEQAVKVVRMKWDAISNKVRFGLPQGLWSYWYATVVVKMREQLCSREVAIRERVKAERKSAEYEARKAEERRFYQEFEEAWFASMWDRLAMIFMRAKRAPTSSFEYFGLSTDASEQDIIKAFRHKSKICHPDTGGSEAAFVELVEHKNKCLAWCKQHSETAN